jgi:HPt (histidine-containing phosphotransfer) domain-containing protein
MLMAQPGCRWQAKRSLRFAFKPEPTMTAVQTDLPPLRSTLADLDLIELVEMFIAELPARRDAIHDCAAEGDWPQLSHLAHQLKGAAGSYGYVPLGKICARLEMVAKNGGAADDLQSVLRELTELQRRICG